MHQSHAEQREGTTAACMEENQSLLLESDERKMPSEAAVLEELQRILESESFRSSARGKQFLSYVVRYRLARHAEPLKERMIGVALFHRPLDYATGDDSVVRAQAREVRRRLEKYNRAREGDSGVRIELPTGSYTPEFHQDAEENMAAIAPVMALQTSGIGSSPQPLFLRPQRLSKKSLLLYFLLVALVVHLVIWGFDSTELHRQFSRSALIRFWRPALNSSKPLLICLAKPVLYRPSVALYQQSARYPGEFDHEVARMTHGPHLASDQLVPWRELGESYEFGVSSGDVQAAIRLSNFLGKQNKDNEIRIGDGYTSEDLRNAPAVVIGAYSNPWTMAMTQSLHYYFADDAKGMRIQEQGMKGQFWPNPATPPGVEYGLVTRLLDSNTGQFVVLVAGIRASGSDAAAELVTNSASLHDALTHAPQNWSQKNLQIVVCAETQNGVAGPAKVVALYVW